jgi:hypothetical protein
MTKGNKPSAIALLTKMRGSNILSISSNILADVLITDVDIKS